jgi:hypothetical protein
MAANKKAKKTGSRITNKIPKDYVDAIGRGEMLWGEREQRQFERGQAKKRAGQHARRRGSRSTFIDPRGR